MPKTKIPESLEPLADFMRRFDDIGKMLRALPSQEEEKEWTRELYKHYPAYEQVDGIETATGRFWDIVKKEEKPGKDILKRKMAVKYKLRELIEILKEKETFKSGTVRLPQNEQKFVDKLIEDTKEGITHNKRQLEKIAREHGIEKRNLAKELAELAIVNIAREIALS